MWPTPTDQLAVELKARSYSMLYHSTRKPNGLIERTLDCTGRSTVCARIGVAVKVAMRRTNERRRIMRSPWVELRYDGHRPGEQDHGPPATPLREHGFVGMPHKEDGACPASCTTGRSSAIVDGGAYLVRPFLDPPIRLQY